MKTPAIIKMIKDDIAEYESEIESLTQGITVMKGILRKAEEGEQENEDPK